MEVKREISRQNKKNYKVKSLQKMSDTVSRSESTLNYQKVNFKAL